MSPTILLGGLTQVQTQILTRHMAFDSLSKKLLFAAPISGIIGVWAAISGLGVWSLVIRDLSFQLVMLIMLWRVSSWRPGLGLSLRHAKELLFFGASQMGSNVTEFLRTQGIVLIIGSALGSTVLGYYHLASRLYTLLINTVSQSVGRVSWALFSRLQSRLRELKRAFLSVIRFSAVLSWPLFLGLCVISSVLMPVAFGSSWRPSVPVLQALSILALFQSITIPMSSLFIAMGKPWLRLQILVVETVLGLAGALLVVRWGIGAVGWTLAAAAALAIPLCFRNAYRMIDIDFNGYFGQIWPIAVAALVMMGCVHGAVNYLSELVAPSVVLLAGIALGGIVYISVLLLLDRSMFADIREISGHLRPARKPAVHNASKR
jgi:PST family polysaccharide transporter